MTIFFAWVISSLNVIYDWFTDIYGAVGISIMAFILAGWAIVQAKNTITNGVNEVSSVLSRGHIERRKGSKSDLDSLNW